MHMFSSNEDFERMIKNLNIDREAPPGHRQELRRQMLAAFAEARSREGLETAWRVRLKGMSIMRNWTIRVAAAVLIVGVIGAGVYWLKGTQSIAFADVVRAIADTRTATFKSTTVPGKGMPAMHFDGIYADPGRMCMVSSQGTVILDSQQGKLTNIIPSLKRVMVVTSKNMPPDAESPNFFETLRTRLQKAEAQGGKNVTALGRKEINGRGVVGYRVKIADDDVITIWADAETKLPVTVEVTTGSVVNTMTDIVLGAAVDEKLFDPQIPKDYAVQEMVIDMSPPTEADLIDLLKTWASHMGGKFPDKIRQSMFEDFSKAQGQAFKDSGREPAMEDIAPLQKLILSMTRGLRFYMELPKGSAKHYAGKGVKLNTPDTPIFWYRPEKSETYRVIYADLTVKDVPPDQLPKSQQDEEDQRQSQ